MGERYGYDGFLADRLSEREIYHYSFLRSHLTRAQTRENYYTALIDAERPMRGLWNKLVTTQAQADRSSYATANLTTAAHRHQKERFRITTGVTRMADTQRDQQREQWLRNLLNPPAPVQQPAPTQTQRRELEEEVKQTQRRGLAQSL